MNRNVYMYLNTHIFPTTGYARVLLFMFIRRELGGTDTGCLFQFTYCVAENISRRESRRQTSSLPAKELTKKRVFIDEIVAPMNLFVAVTYIQCNIRH